MRANTPLFSLKRLHINGFLFLVAISIVFSILQPQKLRLHAMGVTPPAVPCSGCAFSSPIPAQTLGYPAGDGNIYWEGGFETGDFSQWWEDNWGGSWGNSTVTLESNTVRYGNYAAQFVVNPPNTSGAANRGQISASQSQVDWTEGKDYYYSWSMYIPSNTNQTSGWPAWTNVSQWHSSLDCWPLLQLYINDQQHYIVQSRPGGCPNNMPIQEWDAGAISYDKWEDFTYHIKWSVDPSIGYIQVWRNGMQILPLTHVQTLPSNYVPNPTWATWDLQIYRDGGNTNIIYFAGARRHDAYNPNASTPTPTFTPTPTPTLIPTRTSTPCSGLTITTPLSLNKTTVMTGSTITGTVTYTNKCSFPVTVNDLDIAVRTSTGSNADFLPDTNTVTLQSNQSKTVTAYRTIQSSDPTGQWYAFASYQDTSNNWYADTNRVYFTIVKPTPTWGKKHH